MVVGNLFPRISGRALSGTSVTLPDAARGTVALVGVAFVRDAQPMLDSWMRPYEEAFDGRKGYVAYELPIIEGWHWRLMSGMIDGGMRAGIPVEKHNYVVTVYGDASAFREALSIEDTGSAYVFLLGRSGIIRWRNHGYATDAAVDGLVRRAAMLSP
jgi:hypothetical protein